MASEQTLLRYLPILDGIRESSSRVDILAGIALAGLLVPEGMAYAGIAGVPPQMGLYAAMAGLFVYALFGSSRQLAVSATSSSAAMLAALVAPIVTGDSARYALFASAAAVAVGIIFLAGGLFRLGSVSEFISKPVLKGFVFGLALTIMVKQGHKLTGISNGQGNFFQQAWHILTSLRELNPWTLVVGAVAIAIMFLLGAVAPRVPSALVVLVFGTLAVPFLGLHQRGVEVVGLIHAGWPSLSVPRIGTDELADLFVGAFGITLVLMAEALAAGRTFAAKHQYDINPNQELYAMGAANVASGLAGGIIVGGGMSGTAANDANGARSQLSTITAALSVGLTLAFLLPLMRNLPEAVLGAIVVHAVAHLADVKTFKYYAKLRTGSIWTALAALLGVLQMGILKGLMFAVGLTLIAVMYKISANKDSVLGRIPGTRNFVDIERHPEAELIPALLIVRPNGMLFFANANRIRNRLHALVNAAGVPFKVVLLNLESCPEVDVTSLETLLQVNRELADKGIELRFARMTDQVRDLFVRSGFLESIGEARIFADVDVAVDAFLDARRFAVEHS